MVVTWTEPIPGREMKAIEYGADVTAYWTKQAQEGKCSVPENFLSERGCGHWMVNGDRDTLLDVHDIDGPQDLIMRGQLLLGSFSVDFFTAETASDSFLPRFANLPGALS